MPVNGRIMPVKGQIMAARGQIMPLKANIISTKMLNYNQITKFTPSVARFQTVLRIKNPTR